MEREEEEEGRAGILHEWWRGVRKGAEEDGPPWLPVADDIFPCAISNTNLREHSCYMEPLRTILIDLKKYKHTRALYSRHQTHKSTDRPTFRAAGNVRNQPYCALKIHQTLQTGLVSNFLSCLCVLIVLVVAFLQNWTFYKQRL